MFEVLWNIASFVVALGILITVHEYGHFWVARKNGVKVERFSVGFGQPIWRKVDRQGTEYVIALIPLGGYVKMLDERVDDVQEHEKNQAFNNKNVYQRIAIIAAGPFANFAFAIFAFYLMFLIGVPSVKPIVGDIEDGSIVAQSQLPIGGEITQVNGKSVKDWQEVNLALISALGQEQLTIKAKLPDSQYEKSFVLNTTNWNFSPEKTSSLASLGLVPFSPEVSNVISRVQENSPADKSGLLVGDKLIKINQIDTHGDWQQFSKLIREFPNQMVELEIERGGQRQLIDVTPGIRELNGKEVGYLGVNPTVAPWPDNHRIELSYGVIGSISASVNRTWELVVLSFDMIGKLITGDVSVKNLSGPISIAQGAGNSAGYGFVYFLGFLALISINLGIINLLPLPVLDGGHLLYYFIELLTGKPVPEKIQELGFRIGAMVLLALMSIAIFNDISRL